MRWLLACIAVGWWAAPAVAEPDAPVDSRTAAAKVDALLAASLKPDAEVAPSAGDEVFLRRVYLDLVGEPPNPADITAFVLDPSPRKREAVVQKLLADKSYAVNWSRYWRDVIMSRASDLRARLAVPALENYLQSQLAKNSGWDEIATDFITAEGDVREDGRTGLIMAQNGMPEETTSEVARIFLGIQLQCAQCHDHPTDDWKREQFHELAAFFPRVAARPDRSSDKRTYVVVANDGRAFRRPDANTRYRGTPEHYMSDLEDPSARGTLMKPKFFLTGATLKHGTRDSARRGKLAEWITAKENPWFAKALVNRLWGELVGTGFVEPIDDLGPNRSALAPEAFDYLAGQFAAHDYDMRWLFETIAATETYQRASRTRAEADALAAACPQRLRSDQIFSNLARGLDLAEPDALGTGYAAQLARFQSPRNQFEAVFGFDPSTPKEELQGSIPQALALMNSRLVEQAISANRRGGVGQIVREIKDDELAVVELYLRLVAREPTDSELRTAKAYIEEVGRRGEAFEDLAWALINSAEFVHRR